MKMGLLNIDQKNEIAGKEYAPDSFYNPVQDGNLPPNWVISTQEIDQTVNPDFEWVKDLPLIDWVPPVEPPFPPK